MGWIAIYSCMKSLTRIARRCCWRDHTNRKILEALTAAKAVKATWIRCLQTVNLIGGQSAGERRRKPTYSSRPSHRCGANWDNLILPLACSPAASTCKQNPAWRGGSKETYRPKCSLLEYARQEHKHSGPPQFTALGETSLCEGIKLVPRRWWT